MPGAQRNQFQTFSPYQGVPSGYVHPGAWVHPQKSGGISSRFEVNGSGTVAGAMAAGLNVEADITGTGELSPAPAAQLIVQAIAAIFGAGSLSADAVGTLAMAANLAGSGAITASMGALASVVASITAGGSVAGTMFGTGTMECNITGFTELSPQSLAAAVWNSLVASFQEAGSMGEALSTAGSGGLSPTQQTMLTELYRLAGLDATRPLVVTATTREAGAEIEQTIAEAPAGTVTVTRT